jgi:hypothetical protein
VSNPNIYQQPEVKPLAVRGPEAAKMLGLSRTTLYWLRKSGQIKAGRLDPNNEHSELIYPVAELEAFVNRLIPNQATVQDA